MKTSKVKQLNTSYFDSRNWLYLILLSGLVAIAACNQSTLTKQPSEQGTSTLQELQGYEKINALNQKIHDQYSGEEIRKIFAEANLKAPHYPRRQERDKYSSIEDQFEQWISNYPKEYEAYIQILNTYL